MTSIILSITFAQNLSPAIELSTFTAKELAGEFGYAKEVKEYKANPDAYPGHVGDVSTVIRVAMTGRSNTPDLYEIMKVLGKESLLARVEKATK